MYHNNSVSAPLNTFFLKCFYEMKSNLALSGFLRYIPDRFLPYLLAFIKHRGSNHSANNPDNLTFFFGDYSYLIINKILDGFIKCFQVKLNPKIPQTLFIKFYYQLNNPRLIFAGCFSYGEFAEIGHLIHLTHFTSYVRISYGCRRS